MVASRLLGGDFVGDEMVWWQGDPKPYLMHLSCLMYYAQGYPGIRDLTKRQCGIPENANGIRDLTKRQCGIRENGDGIRDLTKILCGIWENANGIRDLTKRKCWIRESADGITDLTATRKTRFGKI